MAEKAILLVDDEALILVALKRALRMRFGSAYLYETALDGSEGLQRIGELVASGVDVVLVISDWLMPGMKGDEFLSLVRARYTSARLIMITGHADEADFAKLAGRFEIDAFLHKPWNPEKLFQAVAKALG